VLTVCEREGIRTQAMNWPVEAVGLDLVVQFGASRIGEDDVVAVGVVHVPAVGHALQRGVGSVEQQREIRLVVVRRLGMVDRNCAPIDVAILRTGAQREEKGSAHRDESASILGQTDVLEHSSSRVTIGASEGKGVRLEQSAIGTLNKN